MPDIRTLPLDLSDPEHPIPGKVEMLLSDPQVVNVDPAFSTNWEISGLHFERIGRGRSFRAVVSGAGEWKVSTGGGKFSVWSPTAHELLFLGTNDHIMVADYTGASEIRSAQANHVHDADYLWIQTPASTPQTR